MKTVKIVALIGAVAMSIALINGFVRGDFFEDGGTLMRNPWGVVSLVDLYVGFVLFSLWIIYRESSWIARVIWVTLMMVFGFLTASIYLWYVFHKAGNDVLTALHGHRANAFIAKESVHERS